MTTVGDILQFVESVAPQHMKFDWDNVGLLCGSCRTEVSRLLVALDPFEHVCREASQWGAELIVTHHPLIFEAPKSVTDETSIGRSIMHLCRHGISAINLHTNLDCAPGGVNDVLACTLGLTNITVLNPRGEDPQNTPWGLLRCGEVPQCTLQAFLANAKEKLGCDGLRYVDGGKPVHKVAVGGGSCAGGLMEVYDAGCDTFVTADIKYNQFWDAKELGINLIDAGHFATENPIVSVLAGKIAVQFPDIEVKISESHGDCINFF